MHEALLQSQLSQRDRAGSCKGQRLNNRKLALVLSFVFPGLGQVCKGEILKGFSFVAICILLIVSVFFFSAPTYLYRSAYWLG